LFPQVAGLCPELSPFPPTSGKSYDHPGNQGNQDQQIKGEKTRLPPAKIPEQNFLAIQSTESRPENYKENNKNYLGHSLLTPKILIRDRLETSPSVRLKRRTPWPSP
jgi:hypothetical protein